MLWTHTNAFKNMPRQGYTGVPEYTTHTQMSHRAAATTAFVVSFAAAAVAAAAAAAAVVASVLVEAVVFVNGFDIIR